MATKLVAGLVFPSQVRLDAFAAALHWANATVGLDQAVKVIVGAADLTLDVQALAKAVQASDASAIGSAIGKVRTLHCVYS
jgi:hypothetical protein